MTAAEIEQKKAEQQAKETAKMNRLLAKTLQILQPPDCGTVTEWAEKHRRLSEGSSAESGRYRVDRTPYMREIMDCFTDPKVSHIVFVAASQVGKSELINNCIGYIIDEDPGNILFIHPAEDDAKDYGRMRIHPMIRSCPRLRTKVADQGSVKSISYPGGVLTMCGSTEAHKLASKPCRYVFMDERDRCKRTVEGDPWVLARARQKTFYNAMGIEVSTPTTAGASPIDDAYSTGTMERWVTKCPHCGQYHEIRFRDIQFEYEMIEIRRKKTYTLQKVWYACPDCGAVSTEREMKNSEAKWVAENPGAIRNGCRSFWLNAFASPWATWDSIILEFLQAKDSPAALQGVTNTSFGELWEDRGDTETEDNLLARREDYGKDDNGDPLELPEGVLFLTCGVDTQDDRFEYEVVGHGEGDITWSIAYGKIPGKPSSEETWEKLDEIIDREWRYHDGIRRKIACTFIDEGGHYTMQVRAQCAKRLRKKVYAIKGVWGEDKPFITLPKKMAILDADKQIVGACWQYQIGVDSGKHEVMDRLCVQIPENKGYCHFPLRPEYGEAYFRGLLSEAYIYNEKTGKFSWKPIPGHKRNEPLDLRDYALAAAASLGKQDWDLLEAILAAERANAGKPAAPKPTPQATITRKTGSGIDNFYRNGDW